jgi:hypothetical protein
MSTKHCHCAHRRHPLPVFLLPPVGTVSLIAANNKNIRSAENHEGGGKLYGKNVNLRDDLLTYPVDGCRCLALGKRARLLAL